MPPLQTSVSCGLLGTKGTLPHQQGAVKRGGELGGNYAIRELGDWEERWTAEGQEEQGSADRELRAVNAER